MTLKFGSRATVLVDTIKVPAASANVPDKHVDVVEDDPALAAISDDAILTFVTPRMMEPRLPLE